MLEKRIIIVWMMIVLSIFLTGCQPASDSILEPSKLFYVHDNSHTLLNATSWSVFNYGEALYKDSNNDAIPEFIQGSQVVVLTHVGDSSDIKSTEIFNHWGIGKNNMGILIILYFSKDGDSYIFDNILFEIGQQMSEYLSAFEANNLITDYFYDPSIPTYDYDARLISLYHGVLSHIYLNVYNYTSYNHQSYMDGYYEIQYDYIRAIPKATFYDDIFGNYWFWIIVGLTILFGGSILQFIPLFFFSSGKSFRGHGGKSIGYWFKR